MKLRVLEEVRVYNSMGVMLHYQCMDKWICELSFHYIQLHYICPDVLPWTVSMSYANPINIRIVNRAKL